MKLCLKALGTLRAWVGKWLTPGFRLKAKPLESMSMRQVAVQSSLACWHSKMCRNHEMVTAGCMLQRTKYPLFSMVFFSILFITAIGWIAMKPKAHIMVPRRWSPLTLMSPWLFLHHEVHICGFKLSYVLTTSELMGEIPGKYYLIMYHIYPNWNNNF